MNTLALTLKLTLASLCFFTIMLNPAMAETDSQGDEKQQQFRGVYYGVFPCRTCPGITATLSLKNKKNYLLVTQKSKESTREFYEKGKYDWDEKAGLVTLTSRKKSITRKLLIKNAKTLIMLSFDGIEMKNNPKKFTLTKREQKEPSGMHSMH